MPLHEARLRVEVVGGCFVWSSELHERFVVAVEAAGGSIAATPRRILPLMRVRGLTWCDETRRHIQDHLRAYRLQMERRVIDDDRAAWSSLHTR